MTTGIQEASMTTAVSCMTNISERLGIPAIQGRTSLTDYQQARCDLLNESVGGLDGMDCPVCRNKGAVYSVTADGEIKSSECECMTKRRSVWAMKYSGLGDLLMKDFENFAVNEDWQDKMKRGAQRYAETEAGEWLYCAGQNGCGKTHICTAVCKRLMERGYTVRYELWGNIYRKLCARRFDEKSYSEYYDLLMAADVLYIDDFLKTNRGKQTVGGISDNEIKIAYEVINGRALSRKKNKKTIISTEYMMDELYAIDVATAGRIKEKAGVYLLQVARVAERDMRQKIKNK